MKLFRSAAVGLGALAVLSAAAFAAGYFPGFSIVGGATYCTSIAGTGNGLGTSTSTAGTFPGNVAPQNFPQGNPQGTGVGSFGVNCNSFAPAGPPALTGAELIPADTQLPGGQQPQTVLIPSSLLGSSTNRLIGGDATTNLNQRSATAKGVTALATLSPTAAVMTADRFWVIAPAAGVTYTVDSTASSAVIPGFNNTKAFRIARTTSGAAGVVCWGQTLDAAASAPLIGNNAVFSFYEENGSTQSATNGNIIVNIDYTSAADAAATQATLGFAGANGSLFALGDVGLLSAGPTNMTRGVAGGSPGTTATVAAGVATIGASTTWTRYAVYAPIPVNIPGGTTAVTSVSVSICWTPTATTAVATDYIELNGLQLEAKPSTVTQSLPAGVISPTSFERRMATVEQAYQQYYLYFNYENQAAITTVAKCDSVTVTTANCIIPFPVPMRIVPVLKYTAGFQAYVQLAQTSVGACSALAAETSYAVVPSTVDAVATCTSTTQVVGGNALTTLGTSSATGIISASAEP